jgi:iron complex transport system substrate-binding protein
VKTYFRRCGLVTTLLMILFISSTLAQDNPIVVVDALGNEITIEDYSRLITIGGAVTETVFALGMEDNIIAVDDSSIYPPETASFESVGYLRFLSSEPILALNPTLIITTEDAGPPEVVRQLEQSGVTFLIVPAEDTIDGATEKIMTIARALDKEAEGQALVDGMLADIATAQELLSNVESDPKVLFVYARGAAVLTVSGTGTGADEIISLARGVNAVTDYEGYKPLTAEAVVAAAPDIILTTSLGVDSLGGIDEMMDLPGVALTPAGQNGRILYTNLDDLFLLGFTPRLGGAILELTYLLHPELPRPIPVDLLLNGNFETLLNLMDLTGLEDTLGDEGNFTLFAPNDDAFKTLPKDMVDSLMSNPESMQTALTYHIVNESLSENDIRNLAENNETITTILGEPLTFSLDDSGGILINGHVHIIESEIEGSNGMIHIIDAVLLPERP